MVEWKIPINTQWMKEQSSHAPSMQYAKDIHAVASRMPKDFTALEIGSAWGFSALAILEAGAKNLLCVDPNIMAKAKSEADANGYGDKCQWTVCRSDKFWEENPTVHYDLIYIDGSHLYPDVSNDLSQAIKRLNAKGLILIDDFRHKKNRLNDPANGYSEYGVSLACWEFYGDHYNQIKGIGIKGQVLWFKI